MLQGQEGPGDPFPQAVVGEKLPHLGIQAQGAMGYLRDLRILFSPVDKAVEEIKRCGISGDRPKAPALGG